MRDNKIVHEEMNLKPYPNYLDKVPNFLRHNLSQQNPNPNTTRNGFQPLPHSPSIEQKPNSIASQVPPIQVIGNSNCQIFLHMPSSLYEIKREPQQTPLVQVTGGYIFQPSSSLASPPIPFVRRHHTFSDKKSIQEVTRNSNRQFFPHMPSSLNEIKPEPQPTPSVPGTGGYIYQPSSSLASPTLPFGMRYHTFSDKTSVQEVDHIFGVTNQGHDLTKCLIDKLERPISEAAKGLESNDKRFNSEIDLTLNL